MREAAKAVFADPGMSLDKVISAAYGPRDSAGERGSRLHKVAETWTVGKEINKADYPETDHGYIDALVQFFTTIKPKVIYTETTVFHKELGYAGTLDLLAQLHDGLTWILDYKTGKNVYPEAGLQQSAYQNATHMKLNDGTIVEMPKVDKTGIVHLKNDGSHSFIEVNEPFDVFLNAYEVWKWANERELI